MAVIYMDHPTHGNKVAVSEDEAKFDETQGWSRRAVAALLRPPVSAPTSVQPSVDNGLLALRHAYEEKFNKRPHHKKSAETLKRELEA